MVFRATVCRKNCCASWEIIDMKYAAILRGINVSGKNLIKMADLKAVLDKAGFKNTATYIQSGNIVFDSASKDAQKLAAEIAELILKNFQCEVPVIVLNEGEVSEIIANNPFLKQSAVQSEHLHVTVLGQIPDTEKINAMKTPDGISDRYVMNGKTIYLHCPDGYGNTKLHNNFFEGKLKVNATTRNWKTMNVLMDMLKV